MPSSTKGSVVISLDTELAWGFHGFDVDDHLSSDGSRERRIIRDLLDVFDEFNAPVTWAVVGHLFLEECTGTHPDVPKPDYDQVNGSWYDDDPGGTIDEHPLRFGKDIVGNILNADVDHEIAAHTFSHILCREPGCTAEVLRAELEANKALADEVGVELTSLVFPRNQVNYLDTVAEQDINVYRGISPEMKLLQKGLFGGARKHVRFYLRTPPVVTPEKVANSLWKLPASQLLQFDPNLYPSERSMVPSLRVRRAKRAMREVMDSGGVYHLWTHPHEFDEHMLTDLRSILEFATQNGLTIRSMREAVRRTAIV